MLSWSFESSKINRRPLKWPVHSRSKNRQGENPCSVRPVKLSLAARNLSLKQVHPHLSSSHVTSHLSFLIECFHEVSGSFVNPCANAGTKAWLLPGEQIQQRLLQPGSCHLPHQPHLTPAWERQNGQKWLQIPAPGKGAWMSVSVTSGAVRLRDGGVLEPTQAMQTKKLRDGLTITLDTTARPHHRKWREQCHCLWWHQLSAFCAYSLYLYTQKCTHKPGKPGRIPHL